MFMRSICSLLSLALASVAVSATVTSFNKPVITRSGRLAITGTGFGSWVEGNRVRLGSTSLIITTWSDTRIVAYVPENTPVGTRQLVVEAASVVSKPRLLKVIARPPLGNRTKWRFEADDYYIMTRPAVAPDGTVYAKGILGHSYALNPDGSLKWVFNDGISEPADMSLMANGNLVIGGGNHVIALSPEGVMLWSRGGLGTSHIAGPTVGPDGHIYGATNPLYGGIGGYEIDANGNLLRTITIRNNAGSTTYPYPVAFSTEDWSFTLPQPRVGSGLPTLYVNRLGGGPRWEQTGAGVSLRQLNGNIYVQYANNTTAFGAYSASGSVAWSSSYNNFGVPQFFPRLGPDGSVYQVAGGTRLVKFGLNGNVVFNWLLGASLQYPAVTPDNQLVLVSAMTNFPDPRLTRAYRQDGSLAWVNSWPFEEGVAIAPISTMTFSPNGDTVYQGTTWNNYATDFRCYLYATRTTP